MLSYFLCNKIQTLQSVNAGTTCSKKAQDVLRCQSSSLGTLTPTTLSAPLAAKSAWTGYNAGHNFLCIHWSISALMEILSWFVVMVVMLLQGKGFFHSLWVLSLKGNEYCSGFRQMGRWMTGWLAPWPQTSMHFFLHDVTISENL
jgi:hypothetical protein